MAPTCYRHIFGLRCCLLLSWRELIWCWSGSVSWGNLLKKKKKLLWQEIQNRRKDSFSFRERSPYSVLEEKSQRNSFSMCPSPLAYTFWPLFRLWSKKTTKRSRCDQSINVTVLVKKKFLVRIQCLENQCMDSASVFGCGNNIKVINTRIPTNLPRFLS